MQQERVEDGCRDEVYDGDLGGETKGFADHGASEDYTYYRFTTWDESSICRPIGLSGAAEPDGIITL